MFLKMYEKIKTLLNLRLIMFLPYLVFAFIFIILPLILLVFKAFIPLKTEQEYNFDNFALVKDTTTWKIMWRSIWLSVLSALICLIIALPYSFFVANSKSKIFKIYAISLIISPLIIFTISKIFALRALFVSIFDENQINNEFFMLIALIYLNLPFMIIPLYTVFRDMPKNILEASADLGYNKFWTLIKVVLPYGMKAIFSGIALVFLMSATTIIISDKFLPSGSQKQFIGNLINKNASLVNAFDLAKVSSLVLITILVLYTVYGIIYLFPLILSKIKGVKHD
ncbi:ABC transporter permease [[Mycoplasma] collis]|uniref:ABC transporter permease n=1 Tax=[Mycoplasma] collis TaxID=2127 RepID=UPI000A994262|nr:ABC transporter permease subunit [[Mycoplasma] collis]